MTYRELLAGLETVEGGVETMPPETSNAAHYARMELANRLAEAREILEALANDETKEEE